MRRAATRWAEGGIFIAVLIIFLQLGFYASVPKGRVQIYVHLRMDLLLTGSLPKHAKQ